MIEKLCISCENLEEYYSINEIEKIKTFVNETSFRND